MRDHEITFPCGVTAKFHDHSEVSAQVPVITVVLKDAPGQGKTISTFSDGSAVFAVRHDSAIMIRDILNEMFPPEPGVKEPAVVIDISKHSQPHDWNTVVAFEPKSEAA